jgi:hypothetical protein
MIKLLKSRNLVLALLSCCFVLTSTALAAKKITVKCDNSGASIKDAIKEIRPGQKGVIYIKGFCNERVIITKDDITLSGNKNGSGNIGGGLKEVIVDGARRIKIEYLEFKGNGYGILAKEGATVDISNCDIHDNVSSGIGVADQSFVRASFNKIKGNGRPDPFYEAGIDVWGSSVVRSRGNLIKKNGYAAVGVTNQSYFRNSQPDPADQDIILQKGCTQGQTAGTCGAEGTIAFDCFHQGMCDLRNADITGIVEVGRASYLDLRDSIINGNFKLFDGGRMHLKDTVGSGLVTCSTFSSPSYASGDVGCGDVIPSAPD